MPAHAAACAAGDDHLQPSVPCKVDRCCQHASDSTRYLTHCNEPVDRHVSRLAPAKVPVRDTTCAARDDHLQAIVPCKVDRCCQHGSPKRHLVHLPESPNSCVVCMLLDVPGQRQFNHCICLPKKHRSSKVLQAASIRMFE